MAKEPSYDELENQYKSLLAMHKDLEIKCQQSEASLAQVVKQSSSPDLAVFSKSQARLIEIETTYRNLFENAGISIWNEDLYSLYQTLEQFRSEGVTDLRRFLKDNPEVVFDLVTKVKVLNVNKATLKLFGSGTEENFINNISYSFGEGAMDVFVDELIAIWDKKSFICSKANYIKTSGEKIKALISIAIPEKAEDFKSVPVTIQDITELDYKEDRLTALLDAISDIVFIFDEEGMYIDILTPKEHPLYDQLKILIGRNVEAVLDSESADFFVKTIRETLDLGKTQTVEYQLELDRGRCWFKGSVSPMRSTFNNKKAVVWVAVEISERKKLESQLRQSQKMEAIGILTGGIAHEFNNLLSPILGYSELYINDKSTDNPYKAGLEQIFIAGNRAKNLVRQLLAYGRQSMSQLESVHLGDILNDAIKLIKNTIPSNISVETKIAPKLQPINGMPNEIHQIILNLVVNAYHAMPDGGRLLITLALKNPKNLITLQSEKQNKSFICLTVSDTGSGIEDIIMERIFDPFFTTKNIGQGSGLGLSVVQGIVEQHDGFIELESKKDIGTSFHIYFAIPETTLKSATHSKKSIIKGEERIMIVDDEEMIVELAKSMLETLAYKVTVFIDCDIAISYLAQHPDDFDLVITDYGMPKMNGIQFTEKVKNINPKIPVVLCTGYGDLIAKENIQQWGMSALLLKPFDFNTLSTTLRSLLDNKI